MAKYEIIIWWSKEDECYLAEVPELPGCMADGETLSELMENVQVIISEWIDRAKELGWEIPQPKGRLMYA
jgi:predicted RNase H-like HicB family nuclease